MEKIYGRFLVGLGDIPGPVADHILGARVSGNSVQVQFLQGQKNVQVSMDMDNAMFLLSLLRSIQLDRGLEMPGDPRGK